MKPFPPEFIDILSSYLYSQDGIDRARVYLNSRKLNQPSIPWVISGDKRDMEWAETYYENYWLLADCLFIPVTDFRDPSNKTLAGFDVRYLGKSEKRSRYIKLKKNSVTPLVYGVDEPTDPLFVTEGAIDAEVFRQLGYSAVSSLTSLSSPRWMAFLLSFSPGKILLAYDNDSQGEKATNHLMDMVSYSEDLSTKVGVFRYRCHDPNDAMALLGWSYLEEQIKLQI